MSDTIVSFAYASNPQTMFSIVPEHGICTSDRKIEIAPEAISQMSIYDQYYSEQTYRTSLANYFISCEDSSSSLEVNTYLDEAFDALDNEPEQMPDKKYLSIRTLQGEERAHYLLVLLGVEQIGLEESQNPESIEPVQANALREGKIPQEVATNTQDFPSTNSPSPSAKPTRISQEQRRSMTPEQRQHCIQYGNIQPSPLMGLSALEAAIRDGDTHTLKTLLQESPTPRTPDLCSPLEYACLHGASPATIQLLLEHGADINQKNAQGRTPLMVAIANEHYDIVKALLNAGADPNIQSEFGYTALHLAVREEKLELAQLLLQFGALDIANSKGQKPSDYACSTLDLDDRIALWKKGMPALSHKEKLIWLVSVIMDVLNAHWHLWLLMRENNQPSRFNTNRTP